MKPFISYLKCKYLLHIFLLHLLHKYYIMFSIKEVFFCVYYKCIYFHYLFIFVSDTRAKDWPLTGSPFPMLTIIASYLYFVKVFGPAYMKDRKPFQINGLIVAYNLLMVVLSAFFFFYVSTIEMFS